MSRQPLLPEDHGVRCELHGAATRRLLLCVGEVVVASLWVVGGIGLVSRRDHSRRLLIVGVCLVCVCPLIGLFSPVHQDVAWPSLVLWLLRASITAGLFTFFGLCYLSDGTVTRVTARGTAGASRRP